MSKSVHTTVTALAIAAVAFSSSAHAGLTGNLGYKTDYLFRGVPQSASSANTGLDYTNGGFYTGTWLADVDNGIEYDVYGGYNFELKNGLKLSAGATAYMYTDEFDEDYTEVNLKAGYSIFSLEHNAGTYDGDMNMDMADDDYSFTALTVGNSVYGKVGAWGGDFDGSYYEAGYKKTVNNLMFTVALSVPDEDMTDFFMMMFGGDEDVYLTLDVMYTFDL
jgi:uncharacterized protein (TIGR02001 family)